MAKILAFGASSSSQSINKKLASYAASLAGDAAVKVLDLNDFPLPIFSEDLEKSDGHPELAKQFLKEIAQSDALIISFAEHNGSYSAAFKNLFDWMTRIERKVFADKPVLVLATSPGKGGAQNVLNQAANSMPHFAANVIGTLSVPTFYETFDAQNNELLDADLKTKLVELVEQLVRA